MAEDGSKSRLGLTLKSISDDKAAPEGVLLKDVSDPNMEKMLRGKGIKSGMQVESVAGENVLGMSYM